MGYVSSSTSTSSSSPHVAAAPRAHTTGLTPNAPIRAAQLTWLVYLLGAIIGFRAYAHVQDEQDEYDAQLICRCLKLMSLLDEQMEIRRQPCSESLDVAIICFLQHLRT